MYSSSTASSANPANAAAVVPCHQRRRRRQSSSSFVAIKQQRQLRELGKALANLEQRLYAAANFANKNCCSSSGNSAGSSRSSSNSRRSSTAATAAMQQKPSNNKAAAKKKQTVPARESAEWTPLCASKHAQNTVNPIRYGIQNSFDLPVFFCLLNFYFADVSRIACQSRRIRRRRQFA